MDIALAVGSVLVLVGMLAGRSGPGGIMFNDYQLAFEVGLLALAVILFSGGPDTRYRMFRASLPPSALLSTVGVALTMLGVALFSWCLTPLSLTEGLLLGAVLAPTDAAAVFSQGAGLARTAPGRARG